MSVEDSKTIMQPVERKKKNNLILVHFDKLSLSVKNNKKKTIEYEIDGSDQFEENIFFQNCLNKRQDNFFSKMIIFVTACGISKNAKALLI